MAYSRWGWDMSQHSWHVPQRLQLEKHRSINPANYCFSCVTRTLNKTFMWHFTTTARLLRESFLLTNCNESFQWMKWNEIHHHMSEIGKNPEETLQEPNLLASSWWPFIIFYMNQSLEMMSFLLLMRLTYILRCITQEEGWGSEKMKRFWAAKLAPALRKEITRRMYENGWEMDF